MTLLKWDITCNLDNDNSDGVERYENENQINRIAESILSRSGMACFRSFSIDDILLILNENGLLDILWSTHDDIGDGFMEVIGLMIVDKINSLNCGCDEKRTIAVRCSRNIFNRMCDLYSYDIDFWGVRILDSSRVIDMMIPTICGLHDIYCIIMEFICSTRMSVISCGSTTFKFLDVSGTVYGYDTL